MLCTLHKSKLYISTCIAKSCVLRCITLTKIWNVRLHLLIPCKPPLVHTTQQLLPADHQVQRKWWLYGDDWKGVKISKGTQKLLGDILSVRAVGGVPHQITTLLLTAGQWHPSSFPWFVASAMGKAAQVNSMWASLEIVFQQCWWSSLFDTPSEWHCRV